MAVNQSLSITEVAGSQNVANNTSKVRILWTSTQSGSSWNGYSRTATYYVSINGGAEQAYPVTYTLPQNSTATIADVTITVTHRNDGTGSVNVRTWMDTGISAGKVEMSKSLTLTTIPRVSVPTLSVNSIDIGKGITIYTNRQSSSFTHHLYYSVNGGAFIGVTSGITDSITWTVPYDILSSIPNSSQATVTIKLYTFNGETNLGNNDASFTAYVHSDATTRPKVTINELKPISTLTSPFDNLFIQGLSRVKPYFTAEGQFGSSITACSVIVEGETYDASDDYTSNHLSGHGLISVTITATDSRGITGTVFENIAVLAYAKPKIMGAVDGTDIVCSRCDKNGNITDSGTYLKVKARRSYSKVAPDAQLNFCSIVVRYGAINGQMSSWQTILAKDNLSTNIVDSGALLGGALAVDTSYVVQVGVKDDISDVVYATFNIPTDKIDSHEGNGFLALGKYSEKAGFECAWDAEFYKDVTIRGDKVNDFPIAMGIDGTWTWRKWHSGVAECWGFCEIPAVAITENSGNLYRSAYGYELWFPSGLFIEPPVSNCFVHTSSNGICFALEGVGASTKDHTCYLHPVGATYQNGVNITIAIRVIGRWK